MFNKELENRIAFLEALDERRAVNNYEMHSLLEKKISELKKSLDSIMENIEAQSMCFKENSFLWHLSERIHLMEDILKIKIVPDRIVDPSYLPPEPKYVTRLKAVKKPKKLKK